MLGKGLTVTDSKQGVYAISVAAEMVAMQIQNLRVYERRGLIDPARSAGGTRLYSGDDVDRLHRIRQLLAEGLNLAGIGKVLALEEEVVRLREEQQQPRSAAPGSGATARQRQRDSADKRLG